MKHAIVTGANGFVGCALVRELISRGVFVTALDLEGGNLPQSEQLRFMSGDLSQMQPVKEGLADCGADIFYHFAWAGSAGPARADTELQLRNAQWTVDCIRLAKELGCNRFVAAGSIMEQETIAAGFAQGNRPGTGYIYGSGKLAAHTMAMSVAADIGIDLIWAQITNAYGAGERSPRFVNTTIQKILHSEPLQFTSGTQNYDFVYITDVAKAFYLIGEKGRSFCHYLIGSGGAKPLKEFILEMKASLAPEREFLFGDVPFTGVSLPLEAYNCQKTLEDTGFQAEISFFDGVRKTMDWIKETDNDTIIRI